MLIRAKGFGRLLAVGFVLSIARAAAAAPAPEALRAECDYGVTLALQGKLAAAESVFTSLLSHSPGDPRALTNLGNLRLLRGDREVALALYGLAAVADTADAGIRLNRAVTLFLMSRDTLARAAAAEAVAMAGGSKPAASLLGLRTREAEDASNKAADMSARIQFPLKRPAQGQRTAVTRSELRGLVAARRPSAAARPVEPPSGHPRSAPETVGESGGVLASASAGSYESNSAAVLYWKR